MPGGFFFARRIFYGNFANQGGVFESVGHGAVKRDGVCCLVFLNNKKILTYKKIYLWFCADNRGAYGRGIV